MERPIMRDEAFLAQKSQPATFADVGVAQDLLDTLAANAHRCVGMAANMIGVRKNIIAVSVGDKLVAMLNPQIIRQSGKYIAEEGCLSLEGERLATRFQKITVRYQDLQLKPHKQEFDGFTAQIIQHEIDHCNGKVI